MNRLRVFVRLHISKKIGDGYSCGKCPLLALYIKVFVQKKFLRIWFMFVYNMLLHGCNAMLKIVSYKSFLRFGWTFSNLKNFKKMTHHTPHELHPLHVNFNSVVIQHKHGYLLKDLWTLENDIPNNFERSSIPMVWSSNPWNFSKLDQF